MKKQSKKKQIQEILSAVEWRLAGKAINGHRKDRGPVFFYRAQRDDVSWVVYPTLENEEGALVLVLDGRKLRGPRDLRGKSEAKSVVYMVDFWSKSRLVDHVSAAIETMVHLRK